MEKIILLLGLFIIAGIYYMAGPVKTTGIPSDLRDAPIGEQLKNGAFGGDSGWVSGQLEDAQVPLPVPVDTPRAASAVQVSNEESGVPVPIISMVVDDHFCRSRDVAYVACTGIRIAPEWVLTARHCVSTALSVHILPSVVDFTDLINNRVPDHWTLCGSSSLIEAFPSFRIDKSDIFYDKGEEAPDLAVIRVPDSLPQSVVKLAERHLVTPESAFFIGLGNRNCVKELPNGKREFRFHSPHNNQMGKVVLKIINESDSVISAVTQKRTSVCGGDSGSGLLVRTNAGLRVVGLLSQSGGSFDMDSMSDRFTPVRSIKNCALYRRLGETFKVFRESCE